MEFHEVANIFPLMSNEEIADLAADIQREGLHHPIVLYEGKILDGRNRYIACLKVGIEPQYNEWENGGSPIDYVVSENLKRRHLTSSQKAVIALEIENQLAKENPPGRPLENKEIIPHLIGQNRDIAAKIIDTNPRYIQDAKRIAQEAPELLEQVRMGKLTIPQAKFRLAEKNKIVPEPIEGKYRIIYADPPWSYGNSMPDYYGEQGKHYPLMALDELCALPIREVAEDNAVLFLWSTSPILEDAFRVINSWGFKYKSSFIWDKIKHVMGHYNSVRHELLLLATRGSCQPDEHKLFDSVYSEERTEHSVKPEYFRTIIDTIYPNGKRIELFARKRTEGWDVYGNESAVS